MTRTLHPLTQALAAAACAGLAFAASAADAPSQAASAPAGTASAPRAAAARGADAPPTRQALETLLGSLPPARAQADVPPRQRTTALRGETLDAAIRRTMGDMPFKENFLRGVFLELNAGAVQPGTTRLVAGAQLQVPHLEDLRSHLQRVLGPQQAATSQATGPSPNDKRLWVRFP